MQEKLTNLIDILSYSAELLKQKGIKNSRLNAEILLSDIMQCERIQLYLNFDKPLSLSETSLYKNHLRRRINQEPLQYILGKANFYGLTILVSDEVMIPRPDTEILVEKVFQDIKQKAAKNIRILEIGCGSGCVSLALAGELNKAGIEYNIKSIDISEPAVKIAQRNQSLLKISDKKLYFENSDIFGFESFNSYDYIISNPPYISIKDYNELDLEIKNYEPKISLTDGEDGFKMFKRICTLKNQSHNESKVFCEIGFGQKDKISDILDEYGFKKFKFHKDLNNILRVIEFEK